MSAVVQVPHAREGVPSPRALLRIGSTTVLATVVVFVPQLMTDAGQTERVSPWVKLAWLVLLLCLVPVVAGVATRRVGARMDARRALLVGLPQIVAVPALVRLDVWLEVQGGYLLPNSSEEAMSYGIGAVLGLVVGMVLALLVSVAAGRGGRTRSLGSRSATPTR